MRLSELDPRWVTTNVEPTTARRGISFECPCAWCQDDAPHPLWALHPQRIIVWFEPCLDGASPVTGGLRWQRISGESFEDLTLSPSIDFKHAGGGWHGLLQNGILTNA